MKTIIFKALALGLLSHALISGPAEAAGPASCPAYSASMVDAAALHALLDDITSILAEDDPSVPTVACQIFTNFGSFLVAVFSGTATVAGSNTSGGFVGNESTGLTRGQEHACRAQILQTWVWNEHCVLGLPE